MRTNPLRKTLFILLERFTNFGDTARQENDPADPGVQATREVRA